MRNNYRTAMGKSLDIDQLRLSNEEVIAVGNMKVNARGDELGPGGEVIRSRNQVMNDYYKLNTPVVAATQNNAVDEAEVFKKYERPAPQPSRTGLRGSLADSVAEKTKKG